MFCEQFQPLENAVLDSPSSPLRQINMQRLLQSKRGSISVDDLKRFTPDHTNFLLSICRHNSDPDPLWTTAAFVADLTGRELHVAIGKPCVAPFTRYDFSPMSQGPLPKTLTRRAVGSGQRRSHTSNRHATPQTRRGTASAAKDNAARSRRRRYRSRHN